MQDPHVPRSPDGKKKAYVRLTADHDALDVANKVRGLTAQLFVALIDVCVCLCRSASSKRSALLDGSFVCVDYVHVHLYYTLHCFMTMYANTPHAMKYTSLRAMDGRSTSTQF